MPKKLTFKPCRICGSPVLAVKRSDRNAYYYPRQCPDCYKRVRDPDARVAKLRNTFAAQGHPRQLPVGSVVIVEGRSTSYRRVKIADPDVWEYEHRIVASQMAGRLLSPEEQVHHINENGLDNRPENLKIVSQAQHRAEHTIQTWSKRHDQCIRCGLSDRPHAARGICSRCYIEVNKGKWTYDGTCPECGVQFTKLKVNKLTTYCSRTCSNRAISRTRNR